MFVRLSGPIFGRRRGYALRSALSGRSCSGALAGEAQSRHVPAWRI